ncbi:MAG: KEOPS complex subunit Pcc1 [Salinigranum sp.]
MKRRVTVRTTHEDADAVAAAIVPDNTESMTTRVDGDAVVTDIERDTTGGLQATADDYVVNLTVAETVARTAREPTRHTNHE